MSLYEFFAVGQDMLGWHNNAKKLRGKEVHWVYYIPALILFIPMMFLVFIKDCFGRK